MPGLIVPGNIQVGKGEMFYNVTVPPTGSTVPLVGGVPTSGTFLGATLSECSFELDPKTLDIMSQQDTGPLDVVLIEERIKATFEIGEFTFQNLLSTYIGSFSQGTFVSFGGIITTPKVALLIVSPFRGLVTPNTGAGQYIEAMIYAPVFAGPRKIPFAREKETRIQVTAMGTSFLQSRPIGDRQGFIAHNVISG